MRFRAPTWLVVPFILLAIPPAQAGMVAFNDTYHVLTDRQRYVSLRAFCVDDHDASNIADSDLFIWTVTKSPSRGRLLGAAPNLVYVPNEGFSGADEFSYNVEYKGASASGMIHINVGASYVPPYGIRAPDFGVTTSHHEVARGATFDYGRGAEAYRRTKSGPYTHFVDVDRGNDTGNPLGTPDRPRRTIPAQALPAGSIVEIHGEASERDVGNVMEIVASRDTSAKRPVFIRGASATEKPLLRRGMLIRGNYVVVENIDFDCSRPGNTREWILVREHRTSANLPTWETYHHVAIRHCRLRGLPSELSGGACGIGFRVSHGEMGPGLSPNDDRHLTEYGVVYDVRVHDFGNWKGRDSNSDYIGTQFAVNARYGSCLDSVFDHIQGDGIALSRNNAQSAQAPSQDIYVGGNHVHHVKENCIDVKMSRRAIISQNRFHTARLSNSSKGQLISILNNDHCDAWPYSDDIWVLYNDVSDGPFGVLCGPEVHLGRDRSPRFTDARVYVVGNVFHHIQPFGATPSENYGYAVGQFAQVQARVVNNTFFRCANGISIGCVDESAAAANQNASLASVNNLFLESYRGGPSIISCRRGKVMPIIREFRNCVFWPRVLLDIGSRKFYSVDDFARESNPVGVAGTLVQVDPGIANPASLDFRPMARSRITGDGAADSVSGEFSRRFPRSDGFPPINHDADGRPFPSTPPIGAFLPQVAGDR